MSLQYLKKEVRDEVDFLHVDNYKSFLQVDFNTSGIQGSFKGRSIKYICSKREGGGQYKSVYLLFYGIILLFKSLQMDSGI